MSKPPSCVSSLRRPEASPERFPPAPPWLPSRREDVPCSCEPRCPFARNPTSLARLLPRSTDAGWPARRFRARAQLFSCRSSSHPDPEPAKPARSRDRAGLRPSQYIREMANNSSQRQVICAHFASHLVGLELEVDLLPFRKPGKTGPLDGTDVHEHIASAIAGLNEAKALLTIEPLDSTCWHFPLQTAPVA